MRIYIVGPVGSGKTTFAQKLSKQLGIKFFELDTIRYYPKEEGARSVKRPDNERTQVFRQIIAQDNWIIEDVGRRCFEEGLMQADIIILLDYPLGVVADRITRRWVKQIMKVEPCEYKPTLMLLIKMYKWLVNYYVGHDSIKWRVGQYGYKTVKICNAKNMNEYMTKLAS